MNILTALIQIEDDGSLALIDMIRFEGQFWLVPEWLPGREPKTERPARIIAVENHELEGPANGADRVLNTPMSRAVLAGQGTTGRRVVESPPVEVPIVTRH